MTKKDIKKEELIKQNEELKNQAMRAMADMQNIRRRAEEEKRGMADYALVSVVLEFLPLIDNFQRSFEHVPEELKKNEWVQGVGHTLAQANRILQNMGIKELPAKQGEQVDPNKHQVVMQGEGEAGKIIEVLEKGYELNGKIIRTAKVKASA